MEKPKKNGVHNGHRQRMKQRYIKQGLSGFQEHEILELLLFFAIPYKNTNTLAHELINHFGSLSAVLNAKPEYLKIFKNMTGNAAVLLNLVNDISALGHISHQFTPRTVNTKTKLHALVREIYREIDKETVFLLLVEKKTRVIDCIKIGEGKESVCYIDTSELAKIVYLRNISRVMLIHNHPDNSKVSVEDIVATKRISYFLDSIKKELAESLVFTNNKVIDIIEIANKKSIQKPNKQPTEKK